MAVGPSVPVEFDRVTGIDVDEVLASSGTLMARNVGSAKIGRLNKA